MRFLRQFRKGRLTKHINKYAPQVKKEKSPTLENVQQIGIILDASNIATQQFATQYAYNLEVKNKKVEVLGYLPKLDKKESPVVNVFSNKEVNWMFKPVSKEVTDFSEHEFDILINLSHRKIMPLEYICALSKAKYIVGNGTDHLQDYYDCLIKLSGELSLKNFIENMNHYLGEI